MPAPTVLAALTIGLVEAARAEGVEIGEIGADLPADPDARVPLLTHLEVWEAVARRPVGLAVGARLGLNGLGVVGYAMPYGATVGQAVALLGRTRTVVHPDAVPDPRRRGEELVFAQVIPAPFARLVEPVDAQAAATLAVMKVLAGRETRPLRVALQRSRPGDTSRHENYYGCPVSWGAPALELAFDAAVLDRPLPRTDPRLFGYLSRRAADLLGGLAAGSGVVERARREIGLALVGGEPDLASVARSLTLSARTLQRRLAAEGTTVAELVEAARRERAFVLLRDPELSAAQVASLLGYSEPPAFFRAFRRWTGLTPRQWRSSPGQVP
ncbi:AraC family transcriptional regulator ligand-binding domain-containing protein [Streptosporangium sp. NPDC002721]|uniref:AraC family transcriptional regulator n=1 Tax=Streptosporangium sp. NPDC002721 TaxID=3366188 RepID=UPI00367C8259